MKITSLYLVAEIYKKNNLIATVVAKYSQPITKITYIHKMLSNYLFIQHMYKTAMIQILWKITKITHTNCLFTRKNIPVWKKSEVIFGFAMGYFLVPMFNLIIKMLNFAQENDLSL